MSEVASPERIKALESIPTLERLFEEIERLSARPAWVPGEKPIFWPEPKSKYVPAQWRYQEMKALMDAAGRLIDVSLSDRRNFALRNPNDDNFRTTNTLVCAYQMILPGELAPSHRHSSHALRFIVDGKGTFSIVNGQKMAMETGDVVLTPGWYWHGHGHDGDKPAYWIDVLDIPLTHLFESMFFEDVHGTPFTADAAVDEELKREGMIMAPAPLPWREEELKYLMRGLGLEDRITAFPMPGITPAPSDGAKG